MLFNIFYLGMFLLYDHIFTNQVAVRYHMHCLTLGWLYKLFNPPPPENIAFILKRYHNIKGLQR